MGLGALLRRLFYGPPPPPIATRLSATEAIGIAQQAAAGHALAKHLEIATARRTEAGTVVWDVETSGVGSFLRFVIDDASGAVLERKVYEGR